MKKFISLILSLLMLFAMSVTAFAVESETVGSTKIVESNGYTFTINERIDEKHQKIRTYSNNHTKSRSAKSVAETKALLIALGMDEDNVNNLSSETLQEFANGTQITVSTSYSKTDKNNNVTYLNENTALQEASQLKEQQDEIKLNRALGISLATDDEPDYEDEFADSYMKVTYAVTYNGAGSFLYSVDREWLTMPFFRGFDSLGSCAMNGTVTNSTRSGNYSYDITYINLGKITYDDYVSVGHNEPKSVRLN